MGIPTDMSARLNTLPLGLLMDEGIEEKVVPGLDFLLSDFTGGEGWPFPVGWNIPVWGWYTAFLLSSLIETELRGVLAGVLDLDDMVAARSSGDAVSELKD